MTVGCRAFHLACADLTATAAPTCSSPADCTPSILLVCPGTNAIAFERARVVRLGCIDLLRRGLDATASRSRPSRLVRDDVSCLNRTRR